MPPWYHLVSRAPHGVRLGGCKWRAYGRTLSTLALSREPPGADYSARCLIASAPFPHPARESFSDARPLPVLSFPGSLAQTSLLGCSRRTRLRHRLCFSRKLSEYFALIIHAGGGRCQGQYPAFKRVKSSDTTWRKITLSDTQPPQRPRNAPGFHHIALRASDFEATLRFYQDGLGFVRTFGWGEGDGRAAMLDTGDGNYLEVFAGGKRAAGEEAPEGALLHFALRTSDVDGDYARALAAGARSQVEPKDVLIAGEYPVPVRLAFVVGLDGEVIEFFQNDAL